MCCPCAGGLVVLYDRIHPLLQNLSTDLSDRDGRERVPRELVVLPFLALALAAENARGGHRRHAHAVPHEEHHALRMRSFAPRGESSGGGSVQAFV